MAVALSTGGSGYTRSDFMISDAAMPQRIEEALQADQTEKFSQVLSGIGGDAKTAQENTVQLVAKITGNDGKADIHELAQAVAEGEVKLEDIPEELLTEELFTELTQLVKAPEEEENTPTKEAAQEAMSELAALFTAQQTVQPDNLSDKSEEISALSQPVEAVQPQQIQPQETLQPQNVQPQPQAEQPQQAQEVQQPQIPQEAVQPQSTDVQEIQVVQAAQTEQPVQAEQVRQEQPEEDTQQPAQRSEEQAPVQSVIAQPQIAEAVSAAEEAPQQDAQDSAELPTQSTPTVQQPQEEPQRSDITDFTVRTAEAKPQSEDSEQPQPQEQETPVFAQSTQRSRVVSKSDELEMIRNTADTAKTTDNAAQLQPQTAQTERPVIFTRADGGEIQVRPSEVAKQVADKLVERTSDLREGETEYTVTLEPQDLGRITVRMTKTADGAVSVSIAAENSRTLRIIEENGSHIQDSLKQNGVQLENWQTVSESQQEAHAEDYRGSSKNPYRESEGKEKEDDSDDKSFAEIIASM